MLCSTGVMLSLLIATVCSTATIYLGDECHLLLPFPEGKSCSKMVSHQSQNFISSLFLNVFNHPRRSQQYLWWLIINVSYSWGLQCCLCKRIYSVTDTISFCLALFKRETMISYLISVAFWFLPFRVQVSMELTLSFLLSQTLAPSATGFQQVWATMPSNSLHYSP